MYPENALICHLCMHDWGWYVCSTYMVCMVFQYIYTISCLCKYIEGRQLKIAASNEHIQRLYILMKWKHEDVALMLHTSYVSLSKANTCTQSDFPCSMRVCFLCMQCLEYLDSQYFSVL